MKYSITTTITALALVLGVYGSVYARGFGASRTSVAVGSRGGVGVSHSAGGVATGPLGGVSAGRATGSTYVGPRGTTVQHGSVSGVSRGPLGGVQVGGAQGTRVTTPGGRTVTTGQAGSVGVGPLGGVHAHSTSGAAVRGPFGGAAVGQHTGVAVGPYGGVGVRTGAVAVGHSTRYYSSTSLHTRGAYVRTGFHYNCFSPTWYRSHTVAWVAPRWIGPSIWVPPVWPTVSLYCGITAPPILYDYGSTVVIENNNVYVNGDKVATAEAYADQAVQLVDRGRQAKTGDKEEWQSLGVFGLVQGEETTAQHIFQLAVNKSGVVRGNYYDAVADNTLSVYGSVDAKSQRTVWSIGEKKNIVFEAGLNNLTQTETPVLVHYGKERSEQMVLVRLEEPKEEKK